jgi:hypothetical protein
MLIGKGITHATRLAQAENNFQSQYLNDAKVFYSD